MGRSPCCDKAKVKKGPWSNEEDSILVNFVANHGNGGNWISLPKQAGLNRCGKSCRLRWLNYLRPDIRHGDFTDDEDYIIYALYNNIGSKWSIIASNLAGRTDNDVKNYWNTKLKKKISSGKFKNMNIPMVNISKHNNTFNSGRSNSSTELLDRSHPFLLGEVGQDDIFDTRKGYENFIQSGYISSNNLGADPEISSYSGSSSSLDVNQNSSGSIAFTGEENEFWMDLLSDSFDDVVVGSQLEEKISEIASLLDDSFS